MMRRDLYYNYISYPNVYEDGGLVGRPNGVQLIPIETKGISPSDAINPNAGNEGGGNKFLNFMNGGGGTPLGSIISAAGTNIANAFLDTEASTAERVAGAMGIPALANQWRADTSKGDAYIKDMQNSMDLNSKNYIQDASSSWGGANAVKQNLKTNISPISFNSAVPSLKDFKGNWWRNMGASVAQGAASGSVGGPWGALGGAVTGLLGSIGGLFGRSGRADRAYKDFLAKRRTLMSAQQSAFDKAVKDQTLSNMQALANGNTQQRINDMANIRAYGGNLFANGGGFIDPNPPFDDWYKTVPSDRNDTTSYNLRRAYELAPKEDLENWRTATPDELISGEKHLNSVYYNENTGEYEFMKSKNHPTLKYELDWYYGNTPEAIDFRGKYNLDKSGEYYKYIPNNTEYAMGGNLYTDLSPNMINLWNNKQQIDQQKVNTQQMNFGLGNSFNYKNMFPNGGVIPPNRPLTREEIDRLTPAEREEYVKKQAIRLYKELYAPSPALYDSREEDDEHTYNVLNRPDQNLYSSFDNIANLFKPSINDYISNERNKRKEAAEKAQQHNGGAGGWGGKLSDEYIDKMINAPDMSWVDYEEEKKTGKKYKESLRNPIPSASLFDKAVDTVLGWLGYGDTNEDKIYDENNRFYANGGQLNSSDLPDNAQYYANGGTHEENPYGGIQVGVDQQGNPNLVEEGEFRWGDYVFSDRINVDPTLLSRYNLAPATKHQSKKANKGKLSYADMAKKYAKKNKELANDPIGKNTLEAYMKRLQDAQEDQKFQDSMEQQKQDAINQYRNALTTPQQGNPMYGAMKYNGMGNADTQQGVNAGMSDLGQQGGGNEVLSNTNRSGNNMLHAYGGNLFWDGGTPQIKPNLLNVNPNLVLGNNYMDSWTANNAGTPRLFSSTTPMFTGENPEANFTAYQKRYPTLPSDAKGMQQLLVNEGYDIGNTGQNKDGVDGIWGNKSQAAWYDFLRAYNHRPNTINQYDLIGSNNQSPTSNSQVSNSGGLNLGVRDGDATTDVNNSGNGQTSYGNAEGNTGTNRSNITDSIKRDTTTTFDTAATKEDPKQVPHYSTAGEYAMFGKGAVPMLYDWMNKTNTKYDPNQRPAYELADMGNNSTFLRTADTIGGYRAPNLIDAERMNNAAQAQGLAALQAALSVGNGNRAFAANQAQQQGYNTQMGIGNNYATAQQANNEERYKTDAYNTAIDQFNANARNTSYQDNQKARQIGQQMAIDAKKYANDYILRNELYADATNRQAMENRAANQATWTDNALNYFIAQAQKNDILNAKNNDITNPYWTDKNGVMHYIGDSGLNSAIYNAFTDGSKEWGDYAVNNGTFTGDRLKAWNALQEKYSAADLKAHPELWKSLVLQEKQARKEEAEKAELAKTDRLNNQRYAFDNNMAQLNSYRTLYGDKFTDGQWYDDLMKRYNDAANAKEFNDVNNLEYWNRVIGDKLNYWQRYNTPVTANQSAYGGYINSNNKSNKREYYNYMRR